MMEKEGLSAAEKLEALVARKEAEALSDMLVNVLREVSEEELAKLADSMEGQEVLDAYLRTRMHHAAGDISQVATDAAASAFTLPAMRQLRWVSADAQKPSALAAALHQCAVRTNIYYRRHSRSDERQGLVSVDPNHEKVMRGLVGMPTHEIRALADSRMGVTILEAYVELAMTSGGNRGDVIIEALSAKATALYDKEKEREPTALAVQLHPYAKKVVRERRVRRRRLRAEAQAREQG